MRTKPKRNTSIPQTGCELLISQLIGFGIEKHDDLVDALTVAVIEITNRGDTGGTVYVGTHDLWNGGGPGSISFGSTRRYSRRQYSPATASDDEFFNSPTGINTNY